MANIDKININGNNHSIKDYRIGNLTTEGNILRVDSFGNLKETEFPSFIKYRTWEPEVNVASSYARRIGWYVRLGNMLLIGFDIQCTASNTTDDVFILFNNEYIGGTSTRGGGGGLCTGLSHTAYSTFSGYFVSNQNIYPRQNLTSSSSGNSASSNMKAVSTSTSILMSGLVTCTADPIYDDIVSKGKNDTEDIEKENI